MTSPRPEPTNSVTPETALARPRTLGRDWPRRFVWAVAVLLLLLVLLVYGSRLLLSFRIYLYVDDAYIHMRFARHLAQGLGLVWNVGEAPVEGFTSFVYVLLLASLERIGIAPLAVAGGFGLACTGISALLTWRLASLINPQGQPENLLAVALMLLTPPFVLWTFAGLETPLFTALLTASALSFLLFRQGKLSAWWVSLLFLLATLTRPEAALLFALTVVMEGADRWRTQRRILDRAILALVVPYAVLFTFFLGWRWSYFGYPLPNTYYAKTGAGFRQIVGGLDYLVGNLTYLLAGITIVVGLASPLVRSRFAWGYQPVYLLVLLLSSWVGVVSSGGDQFPMGRFIMPTLPLFFVLLGYVLTLIPSDSRRFIVLKIATILAVTAIALSFWQPSQWLGQGAPRDPDNEGAGASLGWITGFILMGQTLRSVALPDESIAAVPIGAISYFSNLTVIDMVGVVDSVIAHEPFDPLYTATWRPGHDKGNGAYVLGRRPTYIQLVDRLTRTPQPEPDQHALQYKSVVEIWASEEFHREYEYYPLRLPEGWYYNLYRRTAR